MQHGTIPDAFAARGNRCIQDGLHLCNRQMFDQSDLRLLGWDGQYTLDLIERCWQPVLHEPHERLDGRQTNVPGVRTVATTALEMSQEIGNQRDIDLLKAQLRR